MENPLDIYSLDQYCERIFALLMVTNTKYRFNKLHETLTDFGAKMSTPTLIQHLKHLQKKGFITQKIENRQNITYQVNWKKLQSLKDGLKISQIIDQNEKTFKSLPLSEQIVTLTSIYTWGNLLYLKLYILDILEPHKKPEHRFTYIFMNKWLDTYRLWLLDTCKQSKETSQQALEMIQRGVDGFQNELFEKKSKAP
jgi:DNA-binding HxlR family transcriptional regulator